LPFPNRIGFLSLYRFLSYRIWVILATRLNVVGQDVPRDYFTAITGVEWPNGKTVWKWDGQWTVPSPLHCVYFEFRNIGKLIGFECEYVTHKSRHLSGF